MGVENNECVIATTWEDDAVQAIKEWVATLDEEVRSLFAFVPGTMNGRTTIFLAPCGGKKGWGEDRRVAVLRKDFIAKIETFNYDDGSGPFDWVEVGWGEFGQKILRGNCRDRYEEYAKW